jgi:hypothetical protein
VATERDLAEAQAFDRRRLVTALQSGAPAGREVEREARPGRAALAGIALAVLLLVVAAAGGALAGHREPDRSHPARSSAPRPGPLSAVGRGTDWRRIGDSNP